MEIKSNSNQQNLLFVSLFAVTILFGMQLIRTLIPYFTFLLRDRFGWSTIAAGFIALIIFLMAFLADPIARFFGALPAFLITTVAIGFTRLALQFWRFDPIGDFIIAAAGVIAFIIFLPLALGLAHRSGTNTCLYFAIGLLSGILADLVINGAFLSYDLSWQFGWLPLLLITLLVFGQFFLISRLLRTNLPPDTADSLISIALTWLIIGPFLFLHLLIFSNISWVTTHTGFDFPEAYLYLILTQMAAIAMIFLSQNIYRLVVTICIGVALILAIIFLLFGFQNFWLTGFFLILGQIGLSGSFFLVISRISSGRRMRGLRNISIANGLGMLNMVIFLFAYYAVYDISLPFSNNIIPFLALLIILFTVWPTLREPTLSEGVDWVSLRPLLLVMVIFLIIPLFQLITWSEPESISLNGGPARIMNFNLHNGVDPKGHLGLEAIAQVIEDQNPDIVGFQEVSRGWVINGSVDMLTWMSKRLGMTAIYGPTADNQWGNAILTRLPVLEQENLPLPPDDLLLKRGFMVTKMDRGNNTTINFFNTHYHHIEGEGDIRVQESLEILGVWNEQMNTVIVGDLNAEHGEPEIDIYPQAGFGDVLDLTGVEPGYTNPATEPYRRIDYIWVTPDLSPSDAVIPPDQASDHLPIAVTIE